MQRKTGRQGQRRGARHILTCSLPDTPVFQGRRDDMQFIKPRRPRSCCSPSSGAGAPDETLKHADTAARHALVHDIGGRFRRRGGAASAMGPPELETRWLSASYTRPYDS
jgi:hypothetical protein